jgi:hypothetical protein
MKRVIATALSIALFASIYIGSACVSVTRLANAASASNTSELMGRINLNLLKQSLVDQIVGEYLRKTGETKKVNQLERMAANTYGASVADALLSKMLTGENLVSLLASGSFVVPSVSGPIQMPGIDHLADGFFTALKVIKFVQLRVIEFRTGERSDGENEAAIQMHYEGSGWKLAGLKLPNDLVRRLAASLPAL